MVVVVKLLRIRRPGKVVFHPSRPSKETALRVQWLTELVTEFEPRVVATWEEVPKGVGWGFKAWKRRRGKRHRSGPGCRSCR